LEQRPRNQSHVTNGMFKYHGIEYLQLGQWDGGDITLNPSGIL